MRRRARSLWATCADVGHFVGIGLSVIVVISMVVRSALALATWTHAREEIEARIAASVADRHAHEFVLAPRGAARRQVADYESTITERVESDGHRILSLAVTGPETERVYRYECDVLDGSPPFALSEPLVLFGDFDGELHGGDLFAARARTAPGFPHLDLEGLDASGLSAEQLPGFVRDGSIALARLQGGTDRVDFRLEADADGVVTLRAGDEGLIVVDGNLWIDRGDVPLRIDVEDPVTVVVRGNLYVGRSILVEGSSPLHFYVRRDTGSRWSEGGGRLICGLERGARAGQRSAQATQQDAPRLILEPGFVIEQSATLGADTETAAALVVGGDLRVDGRLYTSGRRVTDPRTVPPGFAVRGTARPGRLRLVEDER